MSPAFKVISNSWGGEKEIKDDGKSLFLIYTLLSTFKENSKMRLIKCRFFSQSLEGKEQGTPAGDNAIMQRSFVIWGDGLWGCQQSSCYSDLTLLVKALFCSTLGINRSENNVVSVLG